MEKITIGDGTYYANYKEPFQQLEGAMLGYPLGELPYDVDGRLLCPYSDRHPAERQTTRADRQGRTRIAQYVLPKTYANLGAHLAKTHGMTADEFKTEAGLNQGTALISERTRLLGSAHALRLQKMENGWAKHHLDEDQSRRGGLKGGHGQRTPQRLNARGCCYLQVVAAAQRIQREHGRITETLLRKEKISARIIEMHFGSWEAFLHRMNEDPQRSGVVRKDADLIHDLQSIAAALGHTPTVSDMRRYEMATRKTYEKHFGSWVGACERAGVQPNVPAVWLSRPFTDEEDIAVLGAYAMTGSYVKAAGRHGIGAPRARDILIRYGIGPLNGNSATHLQRQEQMAFAATIARRIAGWPEEATA